LSKQTISSEWHPQTPKKRRIRAQIGLSQQEKGGKKKEKKEKKKREKEKSLLFF